MTTRELANKGVCLAIDRGAAFRRALVFGLSSLTLWSVSMETLQLVMAAGRWAVSAFEDRNGNGVLDMGWFGPKEPSGFWASFTGWHKPRFEDVAVHIDRKITDADIALK